MKHLAWDEGAIGEAFEQVVGPGFFVPHKTIKTYCGKRVAASKIDNNNYDCPECRSKKTKDTEALADFARILHG